MPKNKQSKEAKVAAKDYSTNWWRGKYTAEEHIEEAFLEGVRFATKNMTDGISQETTKRKHKKHK